MKLTKEEKELILKKREEEDNNKPKFTGEAKHDLYYLKSGRPEIIIDLSSVVRDHGWVFSKKILDKIIVSVNAQINQSLIKVSDKADMFDCFIMGGDELWYDRKGYIEESPETWARENLENIKPV